MRRTALLALPVLFATVLGCEGKPDDGPPPVQMTQQTVDANVAKIQADPNMSPQAKEAAIAGMKRAMASAQGGQGSGKPK